MDEMLKINRHHFAFLGNVKLSKRSMFHLM